MATTVFFVSGTSLTIPSNYNSANNIWEAVGGGAGASYRSGAGGGEYRKITNASYTSSATRTIQIGAGGTGATTNGNTGGSGTFTQLLADNNSTVALKAFGATGPIYGATAGTAGGTGGTGAGGNFNGGAGGTSAGGGGGAGGGAGGPSGVGGAGGAQSSAAGGGGGAGGGGSNGGSTGGSTGTGNGGAGGNGQAGTGGGTAGTGGAAGGAGTAGTGAGGGGGSNTASGGVGATGSIWTQTSNSAAAGPGGGGGGAAGDGSLIHGARVCGSGGLYGGGGGGDGNFASGAVAGGSGAQGILVLTYTPASSGSPYTMPADKGTVTLTGVANILQGPAALIQKNGGTVIGSTSIVTSLPQGTTAGTTILIFVSANGTVTTPSGFTSRSPQVAGLGTYLFEKLSSSGNSSDTPTLTQSAAYDAVWQIAEYKGITAYDTSSGNFSGSLGWGYWSTPSITPASGNKRLFGFVNANVATSGTSGIFSAGDPQSWSNGFTGQRSDQIIGAGGPGHAPEAGGFADLVVAANGSTSYSTSAYINGSVTGNTYAYQSIIAAYTTTSAPTVLSSPLFRSIASADYASRTNTVVSAPTGIVNGDILVLTIALGSATAITTPTMPSGFTVIDHTSYTTGGFTVDQYVAWKRAASESGGYTITHATNNTSAFIACYSNCIASGSPIDVYSKNTATVGTEGGNSRALSITTTVPNTLLLYIDHDWEKKLGRSPPSPFKEHYEDLSYIADNPQPSAGATGDVVAVNSNLNSTSGWAAWLVALKPAVSAGGSPYTMPAATGAVVLAGTATGLRAARQLAAVKGSIALAGTTTGLRAARILTAVKGSITLAGTATGLRAARMLAAATGSITLAGTATGLKYGRVLAAAKGSIALAGLATGLRAARTLTAAKGSIVLTGFGAGLIQSNLKTLLATTGTIALAGQDAVLRYARKLVAAKGTITLAGSLAALLRNRPMAAATGAVVVAGQNVNLVHPVSYRMPAGYSSIRVAGREAGLSRSGTEQPGAMEFGRTAYLRRW